MLGIAEEYIKIFRFEIENPCKDLILVYSSEQDNYTFQPLSHNCQQSCPTGCNDDCHKRIGALMRKNLVFYAYGEDEVVNKKIDGLFDNLENAAKLAYRNRLPKRLPKQDGLPGEVLLDLLVQILEPCAYKLAVRTIFRQMDEREEIKGYDLTYFTRKDAKTTLWLGQAKFGGKYYCKDGIHKDLLDKFTDIYLSKQMFFVSDKQIGTTPEAKSVGSLINKLNIQEIEKSDQERASALIELFKENSISVKIPCLLAYGEGSVYTDISMISIAIEREITEIKNYYSRSAYRFNGFKPEILFLVFPIKDLDKLRGEEGFYAGLYRPTS